MAFTPEILGKAIHGIVTCADERYMYLAGASPLVHHTVTTRRDEDMNKNTVALLELNRAVLCLRPCMLTALATARDVNYNWNYNRGAAR